MFSLSSPQEGSMDPSRFDTLTRSLSTAGSRRHALVAAIGGLGLIGLAQADGADADGACKPACGACQTCKTGHCHKSKQGKKRCRRGTCVANPPGTVSC